MIATVSAELKNCEHTLNTLRYAQRLKRVASSNHTRKGQKNGRDVEDDLDTFLSKKKQRQQQQNEKQQQQQQKVAKRSRISDMSTVKVSRAMGMRFGAGARAMGRILLCTDGLMYR